MKKIILLASLVFSINAFAQVPSYVPTNGLQAWWPLDGNANDLSSSINNGTVNGAISTTDRFGNTNKAYSFNGINQWIEIPDNATLKPQTTISISGWAVLDSSEQSNFPRLINKSHSQSQNYASYQIIGGNRGQDSLGRSGFTVRTSTSYNWTGHGGSIDLLNTWFHFTATYNGQSMKYYINGQLVKTVNQTGTIVYNTENLLFAKGKDGLGNVDYTKCKLDDIGIWNRELTQQEITNLHNTNTVGINENIQSNLFSVFPNPVQSLINVKADNKIIGEVYTIYDNTGRVVLTGKINSNNTTIELGNLSGGIYIFSVGVNKKQMFKIIKE